MAFGHHIKSNLTGLCKDKMLQTTLGDIITLRAQTILCVPKTGRHTEHNIL